MEVAFNNQILKTDQLPQLDPLEFEGLPDAYRRLRWMTWGLVSGLIMLAFFIPFVWLQLHYPEDLSTVAWAVPMTVLVFVFGIWALTEWKGFPLRGYLVRDRDLSYRSGWLFHSSTTVPFNRIQHSEVSQGPIAKRMGICTLKLYTAGSAGANLRIAGLDEEVASQLRAMIDERSGN